MTLQFKKIYFKIIEEVKNSLSVIKHKISSKRMVNFLVFPVLGFVLAAGLIWPCHLALTGKKSPAPSEDPLTANAGVSVSGGMSVRNERPDLSGPVSRGGLDRDDRYLLAKVIEGEAADEPMVGKVAVGAVIINRTRSGEFPGDIKQVIYQPLAFESVANGQYNRTLSADALKAADLAAEGWDPTGGALYYWNPAKAKSHWVWQKPITMKIGRHVFAR